MDILVKSGEEYLPVNSAICMAISYFYFLGVRDLYHRRHTIIMDLMLAGF